MSSEISVNSPFILKGEGILEIVDGSVEFFGYLLKSGDKIRVPRGRMFPFLVRDSVRIIVRGGKLILPKAEIFPTEWFEFFELVAQKISAVDKKPFIIMVIGYIDVGKSSFILYFTNLLTRKGLRVGIIDADIGQSKIGPPGVIGGGVTERPILDVSDVSDFHGYFIGDKSPPGHLLQCVVGIKKVLDKLRDLCDVVLIDTTGLVFGGSGLALKLAKIEILDPSLIVLLEKGRECEHIFRVLKNIAEVIRLPAPKHIVATSREARIFLRELSFKKFISSVCVKEISLSFDEVSLHNVILGSGIPITNAKRIFSHNVKWAELSPNGFLIIVQQDSIHEDKDKIINTARKFLISLKTLYLTSELKMISIEEIKKSPLFSGLGDDEIINLSRILIRRRPEEIPIAVLPDDYYNNLYVGLLQADLDLVGIGIIKRIDFKQRKITLKVALKEGCTINDIRAIKVGYLRLTDDWKEIGKRKVGVG